MIVNDWTRHIFTVFYFIFIDKIYFEDIFN